ncbi:YbjN domain-containing protein [Roseivirga sp. BDSF3-8]|uniref:YbjN domain-containing protein n=1 Tax=Roseivirga sp. BDSF3-8 TaxID=3241598 RepID=UPI003532392F
MSHFEKVKGYLIDLEYEITSENLEEQLLVVEDENRGIKNMIIDIEEPIVVVEQALLKVNGNDPEVFRKLLRKNRDIVHGAFCLDEDGRLIFRDTLQVDSLDCNELESSINSLSMLLAEYYEELIDFSK